MHDALLAVSSQSRGLAAFGVARRRATPSSLGRLEARAFAERRLRVPAMPEGPGVLAAALRTLATFGSPSVRRAARLDVTFHTMDRLRHGARLVPTSSMAAGAKELTRRHGERRSPHEVASVATPLLERVAHMHVLRSAGPAGFPAVVREVRRSPPSHLAASAASAGFGRDLNFSSAVSEENRAGRPRDAAKRPPTATCPTPMGSRSSSCCSA